MGEKPQPRLKYLLAEYNRLLIQQPLLTKSVTSCITMSLGNFLSQKLGQKKRNQRLDWNTISSYATTGLFLIGPLSHKFYSWVEKYIPVDARFSKIQRLLIVMLAFGPTFIFIILFTVPLLEGKGLEASKQRVKLAYWAALKMYWKIWTPFQFININYVPAQYRPLAVSLFSLIWNIYISSKKG